MGVRRVFIIWSYPLFYESVRRLLDSDEIEVVGASSEYILAQNEIGELKPDIIIVDQAEGETPTSTHVLQLLESSSWEPTVISMSLQDSRLSVYHRKQHMAGQAQDLLDLILGG